MGPSGTTCSAQSWIRLNKQSQLRNRGNLAGDRLMLARVLIVHRDDKRLEVQNQWTYIMSRARELALRTTSDCRSEIAARSWDTTLTSVVLHSQYQTILSEMIGYLPRRAMGVGLTLLRNRNSEADHQKMVGVSRGGAPY